MGGGGGGSTTSTEIDPYLKPYVTYGLEEAKKQYESAGPQFFAGKTYVGPSEATSQALKMAQERASAGSPLVRAAQAEQLATIQGRGVNPFLGGALEQANRLSGEEFTKNIQTLQSKASSMGRYGSAAQGQQQMGAQDIFARALTEQGGELAYKSAEAERARQEAAITGAPAMAQSDYFDIQALLKSGQGGEQYQQAELQDAMNRFNYEQNLPGQKLQQFANLFSQVPAGQKTTTTQEGGK